MNEIIYENPKCIVYALISEQSVLTGSFGSPNAAGPELGYDEYLDDF